MPADIEGCVGPPRMTNTDCGILCPCYVVAYEGETDGILFLMSELFAPHWSTPTNFIVLVDRSHSPWKHAGQGATCSQWSGWTVAI